tara:strand:+ start:1605 stop:4034 length:2430 start_codon:yes stop_codon:yes gene_type:complete
MAGSVKGTIGNEEVILNDAATETTLLLILAAMRKSGGGGGNDKASGNLAELAKEAKLTDKSLEELGDSAEGASNALSKGFGHVGAAVKGLANEFLTGGSRISDFTSHITGAVSQIPLIGGLLGGSLQLLTSLVDGQIDTFRQLSNVGMDFGDSLFSAQLAATTSGLSLGAFQQVVTANSAALARFAGDASTGGKRFAAISGQIQKNLGPSFSRLGITMEESAQFTADYIEMQTGLGRAQKMSDRQLAQGAGNLVLEIDKLARVTGKQRDQIAAELKQNMTDKRVKLLFSTLSETAQANLNGVLTMMGTAAPELKDAITEMVATGGVPLSDMGKDIMRLNPRIGELAAGLKGGTVTQEEFAEEVRKTAVQVQNMSAAEKEQIGVQAALGSSVGAASIVFAGMTEMGKGLTEAQQKQKTAQENTQKGLADFERKITEVKNVLMNALVTSGILQTFEKVLGDVVAYLTSPEGIEKIKGVVKSIGDFVNDLLDGFKSGTLMDKIGGYLGTAIKSAFSGLGSLIMGAMFGGGDSAAPEGAAPAGGAAPSSGGSSGGMFSGMDKGLETLAGLVAVGGVVYLAIKGFQSLLGGFAAPTVAAGVLVLTTLLIGTGGAIALAGKGIELAGQGVEKVAAGLERMSQIKDAANLKDVASSLGAIGPALIALTAGGIMESITSFFGADSPFDKIIDGVAKFKNIDKAALDNVVATGGALGSLTAFSAKLDVKNIKNYADEIERLVEALEAMNEQLTKDNNGWSAGKGTNAGSILGGSGSGTGSSEQLIQLNTTMQEVLIAVKDGNTINKRGHSSNGNNIYN